MTQPRGLDEFAARLEGAQALKALHYLIDRVPQLQHWPEQVDGIPVGSIAGRPVFLPLASHSLTVGATGEGKFTCAIAPLALHDVRDARGISCGMVFVDPKNGEAARITRPWREHIREEMTFVLDPYGRAGGADTLNPFDFLDPDADDFFEQCSGFAKALVIQRPKETRGNDFIWDSRGAEWLRAIIGFLAREPGEERTIMRVRQIFSCEADAFIALMERMQNQPGAPAFITNGASDMKRVTSKAEREASGYIATIMEATQFADSARMARVLERSSFDPIVVRSHGATVYVVTEDERLETSAPWVRLMCEIIRQRINRSPLRRHVHWVIDEARAFDAWSFIEGGLRAMRSAHVSLHLFYQNVGQMKGVWGEGWSSIADTRLIRFLGSSDVETCKWIAELAGETQVIEYGLADTVSESRGQSQAIGQTKGVSDAEGTSSGTTFSSAIGFANATSRAQARADGQNWASQRSVTESEGSATSRGEAYGRSFSLTDGYSSQTSSSDTDSRGGSFGYSSGPGGGGSSFTSQSSHSSTTSMSSGLSMSTTEGRSVTQSTNDTQSRSRATGESQSQGGNRSNTHTLGSSRTDSGTQTKGRNNGKTSTHTRSEGSSTTDTTNASQSAGRSRNRTEKRRLMTVDEVRRLDKTQMLVLIDREADCLVDRLNYYAAAPLLARVLEGRLAQSDPDT